MKSTLTNVNSLYAPPKKSTEKNNVEGRRKREKRKEKEKSSLKQVYYIYAGINKILKKKNHRKIQ